MTNARYVFRCFAETKHYSLPLLCNSFRGDDTASDARTLSVIDVPMDTNTQGTHRRIGVNRAIVDLYAMDAACSLGRIHGLALGLRELLASVQHHQRGSPGRRARDTHRVVPKKVKRW